MPDSSGFDRPIGAGAEIAFRQGIRYPQVVPYREHNSVTVPALTNNVVVVEKKFDKGAHGLIMQVGQEASNVGWINFEWRLVVDDGSIRAFGAQTGLVWGRVNAPGEVYGFVPEGRTIKLVVNNPAATAEAASGLLVGYWWPSGHPDKFQ